MSTNSIIGTMNISDSTRWMGKYCHWDGYPSGVGATLFREYRRAYAGNVQNLINYILAEPVGWSAIMGCDLTLAPAWDEAECKAPESYSARGDKPMNPDGDFIRNTDDHAGAQYAYMLNAPAHTMHIYKYVYASGKDWELIAIIDLDGNEPDWDKIPHWPTLPDSEAAPTESAAKSAPDSAPVVQLDLFAAPVVSAEPTPWHENDLVKPAYYATPDPAGEMPAALPYVCAVCGQDVKDNIVHQEGRQFHNDCFERMQAYQQRLERRYERLLERAEKADSDGNAYYNRARQMGEVIPFGQPILIGHHSEKADRRYRERIHRTYGKGFERFQAAERLRERAAASRKSKAISSDDPAALLKLREKLAALEADQAEMVRLNKCVRDITKPKRQTKEEKEARAIAYAEARRQPGVKAINDFLNAERDEKKALQATYPALAPALAKKAGITESLALTLLTPDFMGRIGIADYALKNNSSEIRRIQGRIEELEKRQQAASLGGNETIQYTQGIQIVVNREENRVQICFPGKPGDSIRFQLKQNGFHWSRQHMAWQRQISDSALYWAKDIVTTHANASQI